MPSPEYPPAQRLRFGGSHVRALRKLRIADPTGVPGIDLRYQHRRAHVGVVVHEQSLDCIRG